MMHEAQSSEVVLIVDDVPDNLSVLHDALDEFGYTVLIATNGSQALARAEQAQPHVILLDAVMPGMDGFEVARRLQDNPVTAAIPIIFMTGLTDTEHIVQAFACGSVDYMVKPIQARELIARIQAHVLGAKERRQARQALDAFGHSTLVARAADGRILWQTPLARQLIQAHAIGHESHLEEAAHDWLAAQAVLRMTGQPTYPLTLAHEGKRLTLTVHQATGDDEWLVVLSESSDEASIEALAQAFQLTGREAEVLYWVIKGKTNRDIGDILSLSPRTVHKHLEHVFAKLGVETRTSAATMALAHIRR